MDNELYEALIGADLSGRELRVALAVHRQTSGYNVQEARIAASYIAEMAGLHREDVSRIISELLRQRVLYRTGGSRSPIGISPASEWKIDSKNTRKNDQIKAPQCGVSTTSKVAFLPHNKDSKDITTTDVVVSAPQSKPEPEAEKPKAKRDTFTLSNLLSDNPHGVSEQVLSDWLTCRKKLRAAVTATVWKRVNGELAKCAAFGISADDALAEAQEAGWRGFKAEWLMNRQRTGSVAPRSSGPDFHSDDISWASDLGPF